MLQNDDTFISKYTASYRQTAILILILIRPELRPTQPLGTGLVPEVERTRHGVIHYTHL